MRTFDVLTKNVFFGYNCSQIATSALEGDNLMELSKQEFWGKRNELLCEHIVVCEKLPKVAKPDKAQSAVKIICHQMCSHLRHMAINQVSGIPHSLYVWTKADNNLQGFVWMDTPSYQMRPFKCYLKKVSVETVIVHSGGIEIVNQSTNELDSNPFL